MGEVLKKWMKQSAPMAPGLDAMLNLLVAAKLVENDFEAMLTPFGITRRQYNVLRILKGIYPGGHPRAEIAARVIEQSPDITRIIDRMSEQGLITRSRGKEDKRESLTVITAKGIELADKLAHLVAGFMKNFEKKITTDGCLKLSGLCEKLYEEKVTER
ncbi:MAG: MarR family transcriptional regulator [Bacteroidota bacterium]|nr:MarR family transcriptional regulator [Bacteroidota bacterium]